MLKIKDDVDLKELEKFGFYPDDFLEDKVAIYSNGNVHIEIYDEIYDKWNSRKIYALTSAYLDVLYDLIKADLVEKVGD